MQKSFLCGLHTDHKLDIKMQWNFSESWWEYRLQCTIKDWVEHEYQYREEWLRGNHKPALVSGLKIWPRIWNPNVRYNLLNAFMIQEHQKSKWHNGSKYFLILCNTFKMLHNSYSSNVQCSRFTKAGTHLNCRNKLQRANSMIVYNLAWLAV